MGECSSDRCDASGFIPFDDCAANSINRAANKRRTTTGQATITNTFGSYVCECEIDRERESAWVSEWEREIFYIAKDSAITRTGSKPSHSCSK